MKRNEKMKKTIMKPVRMFIIKNGLSLILILLSIVGILLLLMLTKVIPFGENQWAYFIAIGTAFFSLVSALANLIQASEAQKQRESSERPYVIAFFDGTSNGAMAFIVRNVGNSPAIGVQINCEPAPLDHLGRPINSLSVFSNPISFLPQEKELRQVINSTFRFFENEKHTEFKVTVKYESVYHVEFSDEFFHNLEFLRQLTLPPHTVEDYVKKVSEEINSFSAKFNKHCNILEQQMTNQRYRSIKRVFPNK